MDNNILLLFALILAILMLIAALSSKPSVTEAFIPPCTGDKFKPGCLGDLNDWARDIAPKTSLNRYCENKDAKEQDLRPGQYCVANCNPVKGGPPWNPGRRIRRTNNGFEWNKNGDMKTWHPMDGTSLRLTKTDYCQYVV